MCNEIIFPLLCCSEVVVLLHLSSYKHSRSYIYLLLEKYFERRMLQVAQDYKARGRATNPPLMLRGKAKPKTDTFIFFFFGTSLTFLCALLPVLPHYCSTSNCTEVLKLVQLCVQPKTRKHYALLSGPGLPMG